MDFDCLQNSTTFDVRPTSVQKKLTILEDKPLRPLEQYLNNFKLSLITNMDNVENLKDLEIGFFAWSYKKMCNQRAGTHAATYNRFMQFLSSYPPSLFYHTHLPFDLHALYRIFHPVILCINLYLLPIVILFFLPLFPLLLHLLLLARACGVPAVGVRAVDCWQ